MPDSLHDVDPRLYMTVIREMFRHENDLTNHRTMWLLIVQGLIANAVVTAGRESGEISRVFVCVGILVTLSTFTLLYKSYQARGYLQFLGSEARRGNLREENLPISGWPRRRIKGWRKQSFWLCPWLGKAGDVVEPYFFLPALLVLAWLFILLQSLFKLSTGMLVVLAALLMTGLLAVLCILWVWWQQRDEK